MQLSLSPIRTSKQVVNSVDSRHGPRLFYLMLDLAASERGTDSQAAFRIKVAERQRLRSPLLGEVLLMSDPYEDPPTHAIQDKHKTAENHDAEMPRDTLRENSSEKH